MTGELGISAVCLREAALALPIRIVQMVGHVRKYDAGLPRTLKRKPECPASELRSAKHERVLPAHHRRAVQYVDDVTFLLRRLEVGHNVS